MVAFCHDILESGICNNQGCSLRHDILTCEPCGRIFTERQGYELHIRSSGHLAKASVPFAVVVCPICGPKRIQRRLWESHVQSSAHRSAATQQATSPNVQPLEAATPNGQRHCDICNVNVPGPSWAMHVAGRGHRRAEKFFAYKSVMDEAMKDKHGVTISNLEGGVDFEVIELADTQVSHKKKLQVRLTVPTSQVSIVAIKLTSAGSSSFTVTPLVLPLRVVYGRETLVEISFRQAFPQIGRNEDRIEFTFEDHRLAQRFIIIRLVSAIVGSREDYNRIKPKAPYVPPQRGPRAPEKDIVEGVPPPSIDAFKWVVPLPRALLPKQILSILSSGSVAEIVNQLRRTVLPPSLAAATYNRYFKILLWVEEHRMEFDLQTYDITNARLIKHNQYYHLEVPGLAEKRPSVLTGDKILVQRNSETSGRWFEGHVHFVREREVGLQFHGSFPMTNVGQGHHVRFRLNRIPVRRQHQALDTAFIPERLLFPVLSDIRPLVPHVAPMVMKNRLIATNPPQTRAVRVIVSLHPGSPPFVLFGPPGTGKTVTIVEAIWQILKNDPNAKILACAPSNSAADLIASKLKDLGTDQLFRLYAPSRDKNAVPDELLPFTHRNANGHFSHPPVPTVRRYRVIVSTCISACFAFGIGVPRGHFTHIFIDEAGQATEPEAMVSIKTTADLKTNIILSGDPKQLGPIIRSAVARRLELDISYMERLLNRDVYKPEGGGGNNVVKLTKNYRSHNAILRYPNEQFYDGDLEPCGDPRTVNSYIGSPFLVSATFPIVFHGMAGKDTREASSPSFFNPEEVLQVKAYVEALKDNRRFRTTDADIGIIAPYHAQCQKIRTVLRARAGDVKVGSVEEFQGQERKVIIISTVRSSKDFVDYDVKHTLGFVANPRRFNVAVTRAQALLIIVGDPTVLSLDPLWRSFLNYIYNSRGWKGTPISWDPDEPVRLGGGYDAEIRARGQADMNDLAQRVQNMTLQGAATNDNVEEAEANEDRPWREME